MSRGRTKIGVQRLTNDDLHLIIALLNSVEAYDKNPLELSFVQRKAMILEKIKDEIELRAENKL